MYSREFIEQVRNANRIEEIVTEYLGKAKGGRWFCPWHEDIKHPNLCANKNKQIVRCFACMGHALDVFSFVMKMKGVSFIEAVKILANRVGIQLPEVTPEEKEAYERKLRNQRILKDAMEYYHKQYCDSAEDSPAKKHIANRKLEPGIVKKYGIGFALTEGLKEYLLSKGYSLNDCLELGLLYHRNNTIEDFFRNSLIFPITSKGIVASLVARQLTENANPKYLNLKGEIKHLFNEDILLDSEEVIITEGIIDALTLIQHGYSAIALSGVSLKDESLHRFSGVNSKFACLDPDEAGKKGIKKLGEMFNDDVKIISLPNGMDVDDYFIKYKKTDFERLKQAAKYYIEYEIEKEPAREIHIQDIDYACYCHKKVQAQISIAGVGANFLVPSRIRYRWISKGKNKQVGSGIMNIPSDDPIFVKMCNKSEEYQKKTLETYIEERRKFLIKVDKIEVIERISITQIIALPKIKELKMGSLGTMIMEKGKEYRQKVVYLMGVKDTISNSYIVTGHVIPNPHTSEAILLANSYEVIQEDFDRFIITSEKIAAFDLYKRKDNETIDDYIGKLCDNVVHSFIKIHGELRKDAIVANFLCFHSVLYFYLEGEIVNGWLQIACIGDTTTGKSRISKRIRDQFDIGVYVTGETCSRTGFLYAIDTKTLSICVLRFGLFAQQDRSILIIDGSNYISQEEWGSAREARRSGKLIIERIVKGEHPCRTRLILLANPAQSLSQYIHSVESIRDIFQEPDIARLDICLFFKKSDVSVNEINIPIAKREKPKVTISDKVLKDNILWAMSRQAEDIVIENDAVEAIYEVSTKLQNKFGGATDIPLISNDCKYKIGRIAVSLAALIHSTDDTHEKIIVTSEIVYAVERFVDRIYSASNCRYDEYAKNCKENTSVSDEEFEDIAVAFVLEQEKDRSNIFDELINILKKSNYAQLDALCAKLDKSSSTIKTKIALLKKYGLIRSGKSGYSKTEKFVHFLNLWGEKKALPSLSAQKEQTPYNNEQSSEEEDISDSGMGSDDNEPIKPIKPKPMEEKEDFRESIAVKIQAIRELNKDKKGEEDYEA